MVINPQFIQAEDYSLLNCSMHTLGPQKYSMCPNICFKRTIIQKGLILRKKYLFYDMKVSITIYDRDKK